MYHIIASLQGGSYAKHVHMRRRHLVLYSCGHYSHASESCPHRPLVLQKLDSPLYSRNKPEQRQTDGSMIVIASLLYFGNHLYTAACTSIYKAAFRGSEGPLPPPQTSGQLPPPAPPLPPPLRRKIPPAKKQHEHK